MARTNLPRVVSAASIAFALTAPAQTTAMSVFVDPLIDTLGVSRAEVSTAYLVGTLSCAFLVPFIGRLLDRYGLRRMMVAIALCFGTILLLASAVSEITGLTAAFVGIRVTGQGALQLAATTVVAVYVHTRRGLATGITAAIGAAGISLAPVLLERLVAEWGWRTVWLAEGLTVYALVIPAALWILPRTPAVAPRTGKADMAGGVPAGTCRVNHDWPLRATLRSGMFWALTAAVCVVALVAAALHFHQLSVLGERGMTPAQAAATFVPQTIAGLVATLIFGWLADRLPDRVLIVLTMAVLAVAIVAAGWFGPGYTAVAYSLALGTAANGIRAIEAVALPRHFGTRHLGAIRGVVHALTVGASAFGPLLLALGREHAESYRPALLGMAALPLAVIIAICVVRDPLRRSRRLR